MFGLILKKTLGRLLLKLKKLKKIETKKVIEVYVYENDFWANFYIKYTTPNQKKLGQYGKRK